MRPHPSGRNFARSRASDSVRRRSTAHAYLQRLRSRSRTTDLLAAAARGLALTGWRPGAVPFAQTDLDAFMQQVLERRDANWKKLQQYVLDEREQIEMRGPSGTPLWGERRDYTWYIRDGFFVRSPLKVNGAAVGESDRLKYEKEFLEREQSAGGARSSPAAGCGGAQPTPAPGSRRHPTTWTGSSASRGSRSSSRPPTSSGSSSTRDATRWSDANSSMAATCCESSTTRRNSSRRESRAGARDGRARRRRRAAAGDRMDEAAKSFDARADATDEQVVQGHALDRARPRTRS